MVEFQVDTWGPLRRAMAELSLVHLGQSSQILSESTGGHCNGFSEDSHKITSKK